MLVTLKQLLTHANRHSYAVGAFNVNNLEILQAIVDAASETKSPVIIQTSEGAIEYAGGEYLKAMAYVASKSKVKMAFHLDHGKDLKIVRECIKNGWTSVMYDGSKLPYAENLKKTKQVVACARTKGVSVEAELGAIKGVEDKVSVSEREVFFTDPLQAQDFVRQTGIDALAVSVGTAHGPFKFEGETVLDYARIKKIKSLVSLPLVLHGASGIPANVLDILHEHCEEMHDCVRLSDAKGVSDVAIRKAIKAGINKINIDSDLRIAFTAAVRKTLLEDRELYDPRKLLSPAKNLMKQVAVQKMKLFGCTGKA